MKNSTAMKWTEERWSLTKRGPSAIDRPEEASEEAAEEAEEEDTEEEAEADTEEEEEEEEITKKTSQYKKRSFIRAFFVLKKSPDVYRGIFNIYYF